MTKIDPEQERARMSKVYVAMDDEELRKAGEEPAALTDWAFQALREEMQKRGIDWAGKDMPLPSEMTQSEVATHLGSWPVVLRRYRDMPAAFVEKSVLEAAGLECFLQDDNVVRMDWLWSNAMGGIKLIVREEDAEEAERILSQRPPAEQAGTDRQET